MNADEKKREEEKRERCWNPIILEAVDCKPTCVECDALAIEGSRRQAGRRFEGILNRIQLLIIEVLARHDGDGLWRFPQRQR